MPWGKRKKQKIEEEDELPTGEDDEGSEDDTDTEDEGYEDKISQLNQEIEKLKSAVITDQKKQGRPKKIENQPAEKQEISGEFTLTEDEINMAVTALAATDEYKLYQKVLVGERVAKIIESYAEAMRKKNGIQGNSD